MLHFARAILTRFLAVTFLVCRIIPLRASSILLRWDVIETFPVLTEWQRSMPRFKSNLSDYTCAPPNAITAVAPTAVEVLCCISIP